MRGVTNTKYKNKIGTICFKVVLVEKVNPYLVESLKQLVGTQLFSTEVIPLPEGHYLVYQKSLKAAYNLFDSDKPKAYIARVIILQNILGKNSMFGRAKGFSLNISMLGTTSGSNIRNSSLLFHNGGHFSYSKLVAIPISASSEFLNKCIKCHFLNIHPDSPFMKDYIEEYRMEDFPALNVDISFTYENLDNGSFLNELKDQYSNGIVSKIRKKEELSLFRTYVSYYDIGLWNTVTNKDRNLNHLLNKKAIM